MDDNIVNTMMAIREKLMEYFKGTCVQSLVSDTNVGLFSVGDNVRGRTRSDRWRIGFSQPSLLLLARVPLATLHKEPNTIILHTSVLERSEQLKQLGEQLETFLKRYLPSIKIEKERGSVFYG